MATSDSGYREDTTVSGPKDQRYVYWYTCDCPYLTKFCDENHREVSQVPVAVLQEHLVKKGSS